MPQAKAPTTAKVAKTAQMAAPISGAEKMSKSHGSAGDRQEQRTDRAEFVPGLHEYVVGVVPHGSGIDEAFGLLTSERGVLFGRSVAE